MFFGLFQDKKPKVPELPSPMNLRPGNAVELDLLPFQILENQLQIVLPEGTQTIEAAGFIDLDAGACLSRFYTADDGFIQISTTGGHGLQNINDIKLFIFEETQTLSCQKSVDYWCSENGIIGRPCFQLNNQHYHRVWDARTDGSIPPVKFTEVVHNKSHDTSNYEVEHLAMLYQRPISDSERYEYLLVSLEFTGDNEATAVISLGVDIEQTSMDVMS